MYKVLLVEDEDIIRKGILFSIDWIKFNCTVIGEARNGQEGIEAIQKYKPDIVILDINMPVIDGLEMIKKTIEVYDYSPVIISGYSEFNYAKEAMKYGASGYLLKPLKKEELQETLMRAIEEREIKKAYLERKSSRKELNSISPLKKYNNLMVEDKIVRSMLAYIEKNYESKITLQDVVQALNYSETFLNRKFKEAVGTTFIDYLNRYRVQRAIELMKDKKLPVQEVAWRCGIGDYKYFTTVFRKYVGCSPKEYIAEIY